MDIVFRIDRQLHLDENQALRHGVRYKDIFSTVRLFKRMTFESPPGRINGQH